MKLKLLRPLDASPRSLQRHLLQVALRRLPTACLGEELAEPSSPGASSAGRAQELAHYMPRPRACSRLPKRGLPIQMISVESSGASAKGAQKAAVTKANGCGCSVELREGQQAESKGQQDRAYPPLSLSLSLSMLRTQQPTGRLSAVCIRAMQMRYHDGLARAGGAGKEWGCPLALHRSDMQRDCNPRPIVSANRGRELVHAVGSGAGRCKANGRQGRIVDSRG
ncbi:hypothetical protein L7F22_046957 [Adiantum nelumboides]|nr:hypothetical protein [Adiantum nelumboides]